MPESTKNNSLVNEYGQVEDQDLARKMADTEKEIRDTFTKTDDKAEVDLWANKASEGVFRQETGKEYPDELKEAQEETAYREKADQVEQEIKAEVSKVEEEIKSANEVVSKKEGTKEGDLVEANQSGENYQRSMQEAKDNAELKISSVVSRVEAWETDQDKLTKVKEKINTRLSKIQDMIDLLDGKKGGRGEILNYLKQIAGIKDGDLTIEEEKIYWDREMNRLKAEKQGYEVVNLFFENNNSPADWEKFQKHLQFSLKSEKNLADEYIDKIDKDPAVSNQNKPTGLIKEEAMRDSETIQGILLGLMDKNAQPEDSSESGSDIGEINSELRANQERVRNELRSVEYAWNVFRSGKGEEFNTLINQQTEDLGIADKSKETIEGLVRSRLENSRAALKEVRSILNKSNSIEEFYQEIQNYLDLMHKFEKKELNEASLIADTKKRGKEERKIKNKHRFAGEVLTQYLPPKKDGSKTADKPDASVEAQSPTEGDTQKSSKNPTEKENDDAESKLKTNGPVIANEDLSDEMREDAEKTKNGKKAKKTAEESVEKQLTEEDIKSINAQWELGKSTLKSFQDVLSKEKDDAKKKELQYQIEYIIKTQKSTAENVVEKLGTKFTKEELVKGENLLKKYDKQREELIKAGVADSLMTPEEKQEYYDAQSQKDYFIDVLISKGFSREIAKDIYSQFVFDDIKENGEKEPEYKGGYPAVIEVAPKVELNKDQSAKVEGILKDFDLTAEDAEKIEGFKDLSYEQRLLALENLKQMTLREVRHLALAENENKTVELAGQYAKTTGWKNGGWRKGWLSKVPAGAKLMWNGVTKYYNIGRSKTRIHGELTKEEYGRILQDVVRGVKNEVLERNGKLEIQYLNNLENLNEEESAKTQRFNEIATELSRMPQSLEQLPMGLIKDEHTRAQKRRYDELRAEYQSLLRDEAKDGKINPGILSLLERQAHLELKKEGKDSMDSEARIQALTKAGEIENLIRLNRFFVEHPDAQKELQHIKSGKVWKDALKDTAVERGGFILGGIGARWLGVKALTALGAASSVGTGGIILASAAGVAGGIGGWRGWRRAEESLREMDAQMRGEDFEGKKARRKARQEEWVGAAKEEEVAGKTIINKKGEAIEVTAGKIKKVWELELDEKERREKNIVDANNLTKRLETIMGQIDQLGDEIDKSFAHEGGKGTQTEKLISERLKLAQRLETRLGYTRRKLDEGLVNFGKSEEQVFNQMEMIERLNLAVNYSELHNPTTSTKRKEPSPLEERLEKFIDFKTRQIDSARKWHKLKQMGKGAAYGAGFASLGVGIRWLVEHVGIDVYWKSGGAKGSSSEVMHNTAGTKSEVVMSGRGGGGYESGKGTEMFTGEKYFGGEANLENVKKLTDQFNEEFRFHPEWKNNLLEQGKALDGLRQQLETAGVKDPDALKGIINSAKDQLNGNGNVFIVKGGSQEAKNLAGIESTGGSGGGSTAEQTATAAGAGKSVDAVVGAKTEAAQFINEIKNVGGIKHDSIWGSTHDLIQSKAEELGLEYPGAGKTKLTETEWYNAKTAQFVNELDKSTPGGIKDLVHEGDKIALTKGGDVEFHLSVEESSGIKSGRLADLHHNVADAKAPAIENASSVPESAPIHPEPIWEPMINEPQATDHPWDNRPKQAAGNPINDIFKYPFGRQGAETMTYQNVKNEIAENFLRRNLSREVDVNDPFAIDSDDARRYGELQEYLKELAEKNNSTPKIGETVNQFIQRSEHSITATPEHAVPEAAVGKTMPPHESSQELVIDKDFFKENPAAMPEINTPNNIRISNDKLVADIEFKYNSSGKPIDINAPVVQSGSRIDSMSYLNKSNLQSFDARAEGDRLSTYMEIYNELKNEKMTEEADVVAGKIKEVISGIEKTRHGIIDYSKLPQEIREKLGK